MINVAEVVNDPDFAQPFEIQRSIGQFAQGGWQDSLSLVLAYGVIEVADAQTLNMIAEGDRPEGAMSFWSTYQIFETRKLTPTYGSPGFGGPGYGGGSYGGTQGVSDVIVWRNQPYRILKVWPWVDYGYFHAVGVRMTGA